MDANRASREDLTGALLARRYRVTRLLGHGLVGTVYLCDCLLNEEQVVLKVLHPELKRTPRMATRFENEARSVARLQHENVVRIRDSGEDVQHQVLYLVTDYVEGRNLGGVIAEEWPLSDARIVAIMSQLLAALSAAHALRIVHRDVTPNNILLRARAQADRVAVCDFSLAQLAPLHLSGLSRDSSRRPQGSLGAMVVGAPAYGSPEHARGETLDARSDIYSAGVVLFQLLTRTLPFMANTPLEVALQHCGKPPPPPSGFGHVNPAIEAACLKALSKTREARFQSASDMRDALQAALATSPVARSSSPRISVPARAAARVRARIPTRRLSFEPVRGSPEPLAWHGTFEAHASRVQTLHPASIAPTEREVDSEADSIPKQRSALILVASMAIALVAWGLAVRSLNTESGRSTRQRALETPPPSAATRALPDSRVFVPPAPARVQPQIAPVAARPAPTRPSPTGSPLPKVSDLPAGTAPPAAPDPGVLQEQAKSILGLQPTAAGVVAAPIASAKPQPKPEPVWAHARIVLGDAFTTSAVPNANLLHALDAAALSECYRVALRDGNAPLEPLELRLDIETDQVGHITLATLHGAELPKGLRSCIAQAARTGSVDVKTFGRITGSVPLRFAPR